jgi:hypothetical protein
MCRLSGPTNRFDARSTTGFPQALETAYARPDDPDGPRPNAAPCARRTEKNSDSHAQANRVTVFTSLGEPGGDCRILNPLELAMIVMAEG